MECDRSRLPNDRPRRALPGVPPAVRLLPNFAHLGGHDVAKLRLLAGLALGALREDGDGGLHLAPLLIWGKKRERRSTALSCFGVLLLCCFCCCAFLYQGGTKRGGVLSKRNTRKREQRAERAKEPGAKRKKSARRRRKKRRRTGFFVFRFRSIFFIKPLARISRFSPSFCVLFDPKMPLQAAFRSCSRLPVDTTVPSAHPARMCQQGAAAATQRRRQVRRRLISNSTSLSFRQSGGARLHRAASVQGGGSSR